MMASKGGQPDPGNEAHNDPSEKFWSIYVKKTEKLDKDLVEDWQRTSDRLLISAGLLSAVIAVFTTKSYRSLSPDPRKDSTIAAALAHISLQLAALRSNGSQFVSDIVVPPYAPEPENFSASPAAVWINALWFLALAFSLTCALAATLVRQWARDYKQSIEECQSPRERGVVRAHLYQGLRGFKGSEFVDAISALLHVSFFLFLAGLFLYLFPVNLPIIAL